MSLANRALVTPQLAAALAPVSDHVPAAIWAFLAEVRRRNSERNARLWRQLTEATRALNAAGVEPVLLKGAAIMAPHSHRPFDRLMSDLDLLVPPARIPDALAALQATGFQVARRQHGPAVHAVAELGRPHDVGYIDLHQRAPGPPGLAESVDEAGRYLAVQVEDGRARVPDAAVQILQLVLHDQFHDGDYWRGGFDLRHLADIAQLAPSVTAADWAWLRKACGSDLVRDALEATVLSADRIMGSGAITGEWDRSGSQTFRRWRLQFCHPGLRVPLAAAAAASGWRRLLAHRAENRAGRRRVLGPAAREPFDPAQRLQRLRAILTARPGKI